MKFLITPPSAFVKRFPLNAGTFPCKSIKHKRQLINIIIMGYMGMIIDNIIIGVLSYPTDLQTGNLLIASTGITSAVQKSSFDDLLTVMSA